MAKDKICTPFLAISTDKFTVDTIEDLKVVKRFVLGDVVEVLGFHTKGDGAHHYRIAKAEDDGSGELGQNGIWWCIVHSGEVNVSWFGAKGDGVAGESEYIQKALNIGTYIYINKGKYNINKGLEVRSNTNIIMHKEAIMHNKIHQSNPVGLKKIGIFQNYNVDSPVNSYNLASNFAITGGILLGVKDEAEKNIIAGIGSDLGQDGITISHASNVVIEDVVIKNTYRGHGIEITACTDVVVDNCIIDGTVLTNMDTTRVREAIQLEHSATGTSPSLQDDTLCKNITVKNCTVTKTDTFADHWGSGIGSHNNANEGVFENIIFYNNKIYDCLHAGIMLINYKNSNISKNTIVGCPRGIGYYQSRPLISTVISENRIENSNSGVSIYENSYDVSIYENRFINIQGTAISAQGVMFVKIYKNRFLNCGIGSTVNGSVLTYGLKNCIIEDNLFDKSVDNEVKSAIFAGETSTYLNKDTVIKNNKVLFNCSVSDIYTSASIMNNDVVLSSEFKVFDASSTTLDKSLHSFKTAIVETNSGNFVVDLMKSPFKCNIIDLSQSTNSVTFIEFYLTTNVYGNQLTVSNARYSTIINGTQTTRELTESLGIKITKITGIN